MARPREFQLEEAIDRAMKVFWDRGYEDASLADLLDAMSITRGSFYKAFADKHSVYLAALELYDHQVVEPAARHLSRGRDARGANRIMALFEGALQAAPTRRGCFLCAAAVDRSARDTEADHRIAAMLKRLEDALLSALADRPFQEDEERLKALATTLLSCYLGLQVLCRAGIAEKRATALLNGTRGLLGLAPSFP